MSGDVTVQSLKRLSRLPEGNNPATLIAGQEYDNVLINGGSIDNTDIGLNSQGIGRFTDITATGEADIVALFVSDGATITGDSTFNSQLIVQDVLIANSDLDANGNLNMSGYIVDSVVTAISATGTTQATATALESDINFVTTVASGSGVALPSGEEGMKIRIYNKGANALKIYPFNGSGGTIDAGGANAAATLSLANRGADFVCSAANVWTSNLIGAATS